jgi:flagellar basal-body rod modification protein FlgD
LNLNPQDFINMLVTQLQNQDPLQPTSSSDLLSQVSQIGQLQSSTTMQSTLQGLAQQNQIGSASSLLGKNVTGLDAQGNAQSGLVGAVQVSTSGVTLSLSGGASLDLSNVTGITSAS